jgi:hypothetical protein
MSTRNPVRVPVAVFEGLEAVRESSRVNMLARNEVARIAQELGHFETTVWIIDHRAAYAEGIFAGFAPEEEDAA